MQPAIAAQVMDRDDVRVNEIRDGPRLGPESLSQLRLAHDETRVDHFDRAISMQTQMRGSVDAPHRAPTDEGVEPVLADGLTDEVVLLLVILGIVGSFGVRMERTRFAECLGMLGRPGAADVRRGFVGKPVEKLGRLGRHRSAGGTVGSFGRLSSLHAVSVGRKSNPSSVRVQKTRKEETTCAGKRPGGAPPGRSEISCNDHGSSVIRRRCRRAAAAGPVGVEELTARRSTRS